MLRFSEIMFKLGGSAIVEGARGKGGGGVGNSNLTNYLHIRFERNLECFKFVFELNLECADFRMFTNFSISRKRE